MHLACISLMLFPEKIGGGTGIAFAPGIPLRAADFGKAGSYSIMVCDRNDLSVEVPSMEIVDNSYRFTFTLGEKSFIPVIKVTEKNSGKAIIMAVPGRVPKYSELPSGVRRIVIKGYLLDAESTARALMLLESPADPKVPIITLTEEESRLEVVTRVFTKTKTAMDTVIENISDGVTTIIEIAKTVTTVTSVLIAPETPQEIKNSLIKAVRPKPTASDSIVDFIGVVKSPDPLVQKVITGATLPVAMNIGAGLTVGANTDPVSVPPVISAIVNNPSKYTPPSLTSITASPTMVRPGATVSLYFSSDKPLFMAPTVVIFGRPAAVVQTAQNSYAASLKIEAGAAPASGFLISGIYDIYGNQADDVSRTTDGTPLVLGSGSDMAESPKISPEGGIYNDTVTVSLSSKTPGAVIIYTVNGEKPVRGNASVYKTPFEIGATATVKAASYAEGLQDSGVSAAVFTIIRDAVKTAAPVAKPVPGTYSTAQKVEFYSATAGAAIYYTLDGSEPSLTAGIKYSGPVTVGSTVNVRAVAVREGMANSAVETFRYVIIPQSSASYGMKASQRRKGAIGLVVDKPGAKIYYTLDGSEPTPANGILYTGGDIVIENEGLLKAAAFYEEEKSGEISVPVVVGAEALNAALAAGNGSVIALPGASYNGQEISAATILNLVPASGGTGGSVAEAATYEQIKLAAAVDSVKKISVSAGDYSAEGPLVFNRPGITVEGSGGSTLVGGLRIASDDVIIKNLVVKGFSGETRDGLACAVYSAAAGTVLDNVSVTAVSPGGGAMGVLFAGGGQTVINSTLHVTAPAGAKVIQAELSGENKTFAANIIYSGGVVVDPASTYTVDSRSNTFVGGLAGWVIPDSYTGGTPVDTQKIEQIYSMGDYTRLDPGASAVVSENPETVGKTVEGTVLAFASLADNGSQPWQVRIKFSPRSGASEVKVQYSTDGLSWIDDGAALSSSSATAALMFKASGGKSYFVRIKTAGGPYEGVSETVLIRTPEGAKMEKPAASCDPQGAISLYLPSGDSLAAVYFTLDGGDPDPSKGGRLYKTPFTSLAGVKYITAAAYREGYLPSEPLVLPVADSPEKIDAFLDAGFELVIASGGNYFGDHMCERNAMLGPISGYGSSKAAPVSSCDAMKAALSAKRIALIKAGSCDVSNAGPLTIKRPVTIAGLAGLTSFGGLNIASDGVTVKNVTVKGFTAFAAGGLNYAVYSVSRDTVLDGVSVEGAGNGSECRAFYMTGWRQKLVNCKADVPAGLFGGADKTLASNDFKAGGAAVETGATFSSGSSANRFYGEGRAWTLAPDYFTGVPAALAEVEKIYVMGDYSAMADSAVAVFSETAGAYRDGTKFVFVNIADDGSSAEGLSVKFNPVAFAFALSAQYSADGSAWSDDAAVFAASAVSARLAFKPVSGALYFVRLKIVDKHGVSAVSESVKVRALAKRPLEIVSVVSAGGGARVSFAFNMPLYGPDRKPLASTFDHSSVVTVSGALVGSAFHAAPERAITFELNGASQGASLKFSAGALFNEDGSALEERAYYMHGWERSWSENSDVTPPSKPVEAEPFVSGTSKSSAFNIKVKADAGCSVYARIGGADALADQANGRVISDAAGNAVLPVAIEKFGADGTKSIEITAVDGAGNASESLAVKFEKHSRAPAAPVEVASAAKNGTSQTADFSIIVTAGEGLSVTASLGGANVIKGLASVNVSGGTATLPIDFASLGAAGNKSIEIVAKDAAGNVSTPLIVGVFKSVPPVVVPVAQDVTPPAKPVETGDPVKNNSRQRADFTITVSAEAGTRVTAADGNGANLLSGGVSSVTAEGGSASLPIKISAMASEGANAINIKAADAAGNVSEALVVTIIKDTVKPSVVETDPANKKDGTSQNANFAIAVTTEAGATLTAKVGASTALAGGAQSATADGEGKASLNIDITRLTDNGQPTAIIIAAVDLAGNATETPLTVNVTRAASKPAAPVVADDSPTKNGDTRRADFAIKVTAAAGLTVTAKIGDNSVASGVVENSGVYTVSVNIGAVGFAEGANTISIKAKDANNVESDPLNVSVTKDTQVALSELTAFNGTTRSQNFTIKVKTDPNATVTAKVGGNSVLQDNVASVTAAGVIEGEAVLKSAELPVDITKLSFGVNTIAVASTDAVGNSASINISVTRPENDTTPPARPIEDISLLPKEGTTQSSDFYIVVRTEAQATVTATLDGANVLDGVAAVAADDNGAANLPVSIAALGAAGAKAINVIAKDASNNASQPLVVNVTKAAAPVAPATPEDVSVPLVDGSSKRADFTITAATTAGAQVSARLGVMLLTTQTADAVTGKVSLPIAVSSLANGLNVIDMSASKNGLDSGVGQVYVTVDTVAPAAPTLVDPAQNSIQSSNFIVTVQTEAGAAVSAKLQGTETSVLVNSASSVTADSAGSAKLPVNIAALGADGAANITVAAVDAAGNAQSGGPLVVSVNKNTTPPTIPVETTNPSVAGTYKKANFDITVTAKANSIITALVNGSSVLVDAEGAAADNAVASGGSATLRVGIGRLAEGANSIVIRSADAAGTSGALTLSVIKDTVAPLKPSVDSSSLAYEGAIVSSSFDIILAAETGSSVKAEVRKGDGTFVNNATPVTASGGKATLAINALNAGANPKLVITATDAAGNVSSALTVNLVRDLTPPVPVEVAPVKNGTYQKADFNITVGAEANSTVYARKGSSAGATVLKNSAASVTAGGDGQAVLPVGIAEMGAEGACDVYITCNNGGSTSKALIVKVVKDTVLPTISEPAPQLTGTQTNNFYITVQTEAYAFVTAQLSGAGVLMNNASSVKADANGKAVLGIDYAKMGAAATKTLDLAATDAAGNISSMQKSVTIGTVDNNALVEDTTTYPAKNNTNQTANFTIYVSLANSADKGITAKVAETSTALGTNTVSASKSSLLVDISLLSAGLNTIIVNSTNNQGAVTTTPPLILKVTKDTQSDTPVLFEAFDQTIEWKTNFNVKVTSEPGATVTAKVGGNSVLQNNAASVAADQTTGLAVLPIDLSKLADGNNSISIRCVDKYSNPESAALTVTANKYVPGGAPPAAVPAAPVEGLPSVNDTKQKAGFNINVVSLKDMKITATSGGNNVIAGADTELAVTADDGSLAIPVDIAKLGGDGLKSITLRSKNTGGTVSDDALTIAVTVDTTAPAAPMVPVPPASPKTTGFDIDAKAEAGAKVTAKIGADSVLRDVAYVVADANGDAKLPVDITMLASGNNDISLRAADDVGNESGATVVSVVRNVVPGFVTGVVLDAETDAGVGGATVTIKNFGGATVSTGATDGGGGYRIETPFGYNYTMEVAKAGTTTSTYYDVKVDDSTVYLETIPHVTADPNDFTGANTGMIIDATNGRAVPGAVINLRPGINNKKGVIKMSTVSNSSGMYSFSGTNPGNYTIEVIKSGFETGYFAVPHVGKSRTITRDCEIVPVMAPGQARIVLTWKAHPPDLDGHLAVPAGAGKYHIYTRTPAYIVNGVTKAKLEYDDTNGYGPETMLISVPEAGIYRFWVGRQSPGGSPLGALGMQVKIYLCTSGGLITRTITAPNADGTVWKAFEMNGNYIMPVNSIVNISKTDLDVQIKQ